LQSSQALIRSTIKGIAKRYTTQANSKPTIANEMRFAVINEISEARRLDVQPKRFSLILPSQVAIAEAKPQLNPFLENLPFSLRDRLFFSFSCLFRQ